VSLTTLFGDIFGDSKGDFVDNGGEVERGGDGSEGNDDNNDLLLYMLLGGEKGIIELGDDNNRK